MAPRPAQTSNSWYFLIHPAKAVSKGYEWLRLDDTPRAFIRALYKKYQLTYTVKSARRGPPPVKAFFGECAEALYRAVSSLLVKPTTSDLYIKLLQVLSSPTTKPHANWDYAISAN